MSRDIAIRGRWAQLRQLPRHGFGKRLIYLKYRVGYRLSRFQTGPNEGDWFAIVTYADATAYEKAQALFPKDPELQRVFIEIVKFDKRISREMVIDLDL